MAKKPRTGREKRPVKSRAPSGGWRIYRWAYCTVFAVLVATYLCLIYIPTPQAITLHLFSLSKAGYYWIVSSLVVLEVIIWLAALYGSVRIKNYSELVKDSADGRALTILSNGLLFLTMTQPFTAALSSSFNLISRHVPGAQKGLTIANNYIDILLAALAFAIIAWGASRLYGLLRRPKEPLPQTVWAISLIIASSVYSYFLVIQPIHTPLARRIYYLPDWLLVLTVAVPYLIIWYLGLRAAYLTYLYLKGVNGRLYRAALAYISAGLALVVVSSVATRVLVSLAAHLSALKLTPLLLIIYGLLVLDGAGFILIAVGAKKLRRLEEA